MDVNEARRRIPFGIPFVLSLLPIVAGCSSIGSVSRSHYSPEEATAITATSATLPYLKAHLHDGSVVVFLQWSIDDKHRVVDGNAEIYDFNRSHLRTVEHHKLSFDNIALFETNTLASSGAARAMSIMTVASSLMTIYCIANPKACFGSCPTFYAWNGKEMALMAEGFSSSVLPSLEDVDVDALYDAKPYGREFMVRMNNEALETHVVRYVHVLAVPRSVGTRVMVSPEKRFFEVSDITIPSQCLSQEGEIGGFLEAFDGKERFSDADSLNLAEKETLEVRFDLPFPKSPGLILGFRNSLMSTYLFYQGLAYLGRSAGSWLAAQEVSKSFEQSLAGLKKVLGGIEVFAREPHGDWKKIAEVDETGPIARNIQIIPLPEDFRWDGRIMLRMTKGMWRLDYLALGTVRLAEEPIRLTPVRAQQKGSDSGESLRRISDPDEVLTTLPGDEHTLVYELPDNPENYELFLESRGYYLEWLREEWLAEENHRRAATLITDPGQFLRNEAPRFKAAERTMEKTFWESKYVRQPAQ